MKDSFVYIWIDSVTGMKYIGAHKGTETDGYICSSKYMMEEYNKRPNDFQREIIYYGPFDECLKEELRLLHEVDAAHSPEYYNMHNGTGVFVLIKHTEKSKEKMRKSQRGKTHSPEARRKLSLALLGRKKGPMSLESRIKMSKSATGRKLSPETIDKQRIAQQKRRMLEKEK